MSNLPKEVREAICAKIEEEVRTIAVVSDGTDMGYYLVDAIADARHETDLGTAGDILRDASADIFDAALSALGEAGYAVVPVRPTETMVVAGRTAQCANNSSSMYAAWTAMLSASQEQSDV